MSMSLRTSLWRAKASLSMQARVLYRFYSSQREKPAEKRYTDTVLLPKTNFQAKINGKKRVEMDQYIQDVRSFVNLILFIFVLK